MVLTYLTKMWDGQPNVGTNKNEKLSFTRFFDDTVPILQTEYNNI